jgi:hypothetical protein
VYVIYMSWIFMAVLGVLLFANGVAQSQTNCPTIEVDGPPGIVKSGEVFPFTVAVRGVSDASQPGFSWAVSSGKIRSGQGTRSIAVIDPEGHGITATVKVNGLPAGCPSESSGIYMWDPAPKAEKFYEVPGHQALSKLNIGFLSSTLRDHPSDQLYVIIHGKNNAPNLRRQNELVRAFKSMGVEPGWVTITTVLGEPNVTQFWRVPPGANNPEPGQFGQENKNAKFCPTITITGPAGVTHSGNSAVFSVSVSDQIDENLLFAWLTSRGEIIEGQGSRVIKVLSSEDDRGGTISVTVRIKGLPDGCTDSATEKAVVVPGCALPAELDEYANLPVRDELARLDASVAEVTDGPDHLLFIIHKSPRETERSYQLRIDRIKRHLTIKRKFPSSRLHFVRSVGPTRTVIYRVAPDAIDGFKASVSSN